MMCMGMISMIVYVYFPHPKKLPRKRIGQHIISSVFQSGWEASRRMCCDLELLIKLICVETKTCIHM